ADGYPGWLQDGFGKLISTLSSADPAAEVWTWGSDKHVRFWARRMLHETTVHRADLELAAGEAPELDAAASVDGIDEFLDNLPHAAYFAPNVENLRGSGEVLAMRASDHDVGWTIRLTTDGFVWQHDRDDADVDIAGRAADLLLFVYGRKDATADGLDVTGDEKLLERWTSNSSI
ncbi:MAG: maleylpyruvate isomerase family mycothiol-dependent enzyme, partial [Actinomycetota bacterium]|nr:maleylpyruvate isomerase family mycothiol-dependent enzyme [Actinomycetota bacterium]